MEYFLQPKEVEGLQHFLTYHRTCRLNVDGTSSNISLEFTQTGIGVALAVKCRSCALEDNITDYSTW